MTGIDRVSSQSVSRAYVQNADATQTGSAQQAGKAGQHRHQAPKADSVTLSDSPRSLAAARDARKQKVADIKQRGNDGTYNVSARALAQKMVEATKNSS